MNFGTNDVISGVDGYFGRFPINSDPAYLFHSLMVYALVTPDRSGTGDRQIPFLGSPVGGVFAPVDKTSGSEYGPTQFVTADVMLGWYDGKGLVWVMDKAGDEQTAGQVIFGSPSGARIGIKPFIVWDDPPKPGSNITLLVDASRRDQPINGIIIRGAGLGARAVFEDHYFLPVGDHQHVSQHRGPDIPTKSTRIHDINADGEVDEDVWAGLDKLCVVMPQADGCAGGIAGEYTLAQNYAAKTGPGWGLAVFEETGGFGAGHSGVKPKLESVMAYQAYAKKGPHTAGHPTNDKHKQGQTDEGAVNSAHDHGERYVYQNIEMDGPELFEEVYETGVGEGIIKVRVHKQWKADDTHAGPCGTLAGRWREHAKVLSVPIWDEPAVKEEPAAKEEPALKEEAAIKGETAYKGDPVGKAAEDPAGKPRSPMRRDDPSEKPRGGGDPEQEVFGVFYDPAWDEGLPQIDFPDYSQVARPDSEDGVSGVVAGAMANVSGEWQGLPEIQPGNAATAGAEPPPDFGPLELRRHSIEYAARPNLFAKPKLRVPSMPPPPPPNMSELPPGDPHREAYLNDIADWHNENMLAGVTGENWDSHVKAPVGLHATAFAKTKPNGFSYNTRAEYLVSRDVSRPRKFVSGTADGGVFYHPHEVKHWMLAYGYAGADLPSSPSQPEVGLRKGVRLAFMEALKADDGSRGVSGVYVEQTAADTLSVKGIGSDAAADIDKLLAVDVMLGLASMTDPEISTLTNYRDGALVWASERNRAIRAKDSTLIPLDEGPVAWLTANTTLGDEHRDIFVGEAKGAGITLTLPSAPRDGQWYRLRTYGSTYNATIARNGKSINGVGADFTLTASGAQGWVTIMYSDDLGSWYTG